MSKIILAIKSEFVERILRKEKLFEFRKRIPQQSVDEIFIYCTYPVMKVVASVKVKNVISGSPSAVWEQTKHAAGISRKLYRQYFTNTKAAYAFVLGDVTYYDNPMDISAFGLKTAPQSFAYVKEKNSQT